MINREKPQKDQAVDLATHFMREASFQVDTIYGKDAALMHPELVVAFVASATQIYNRALLSQTINQLHRKLT